MTTALVSGLTDCIQILHNLQNTAASSLVPYILHGCKGTCMSPHPHMSDKASGTCLPIQINGDDTMIIPFHTQLWEAHSQCKNFDSHVVTWSQNLISWKNTTWYHEVLLKPPFTTLCILHLFGSGIHLRQVWFGFKVYAELLQRKHLLQLARAQHCTRQHLALKGISHDKPA